MYASKITPLASATVALATVLTLGACGKKIDDARTTPVTPAPMSGPSTKPLGSSMGTPAGTAGMPPPRVPASGSTN